MGVGVGVGGGLAERVVAITRADVTFASPRSCSNDVPSCICSPLLDASA